MGEIRNRDASPSDASLKERAKNIAKVEQRIRTYDENTEKMNVLILQVRDCSKRVNSAVSVGDLQTALADLYKLFKIDEDGNIEWEEWAKRDGVEWDFDGLLQGNKGFSDVPEEVREKYRVAMLKYENIYGELHYEAQYGIREVANERYVDLLEEEGYQVIFYDKREEGGEDNTTRRTLLRKDNNFYFVSPDPWVTDEAIESGEVVKIGDYNYPPLRAEKDNIDLVRNAVVENYRKGLTDERVLEEAKRLPPLQKIKN